MNKHKRIFLGLCASAVALATTLSAPAAFAQAYPQKPIRLIVPWPAGGATDSVGRAVAEALRVQLGQSVIVDNIAGAGGNIGTQQFIRQPHDGYTLLLATSSTNSANPYLYKRTGFDPIKDFTPVASLAVIPSVMVVAAASPYKTPADIVSAARAKPGSLSYGSGGVGNSAHLAGELFKSVARIDAIHVPYKGSSPALTDVMAGQLDYMLDTGAYGQIKGGKIRAIAVASDKRHPMLPGVPTFDELGIKGMHMNAWYGLAAPAGTPSAVVDRLNAAVQTAFRTGDLGKRLADIGAEVRPGDAASFAAFWKSELDRYAGLVKLTGASLD
ncbi:Tripartite-type tricarboxylate transporter, receptor component TctC [Variovorax sp. YR752]|jgi:tripartite-type tricarboxylate transporter receptor subunit TctC|uniref:Bug family tripartite tricarboxylate transporter substrate binding protein n=1 Tax=Variovorax TaxID=34072 RepID=UPI000BD53E8B|nr:MULTISPECIES: tripartite tricarboxylate transporter substrate binding protein [Variovorax]MDQ0081818.1 tripartite-type tricarboxylate transporter receptor subunit TctC [Variovorax boronicumulans]SOD26313.1 Tripartite-type tricarboxylate transporter, receptor component TctC [Variovorax sp. YR752]